MSNESVASQSFANPKPPVSDGAGQPLPNSPATKAKSLRPLFENLASAGTHLDSILEDLELSPDEAQSLLASQKFRTHRQLRTELISQQLQLAAQDHAHYAMQRLLDLSNSHHPAVARLAATQILAYAGLTPPAPHKPSLLHPLSPPPSPQSPSPSPPIESPLSPTPLKFPLQSQIREEANPKSVLHDIPQKNPFLSFRAFVTSCFRRPVAITSMCLLALLTTAQAQTAPAPQISFPEGKDTVTVPLARARENLCAKVSLDNHPAGFYIIDTGSSHCLVDPAFAEKWKLPVLGAATILGATGRDQTRYRLAHTLDLAGISLPNAPLLEKDLAQSVYQLPHLPMKGILGYDFLGQIPFTLDFQSATLTLHRPGTFTPPPNAVAYPLESLMNCPAVRVRINDQAEGFFLLDTGAAGVDLTPLGVRLVPEVERESGCGLVVAGGIGGTDFYLRGPLTIDYLGHHLAATARFPMHKPISGNDSKQLGRLGYDCFPNARLTIDGPHAKIYVEWLPPLSVEAWIKAAGDPRKPDLFNSPPLTRAAAEDRLDVAQALVAAGANVAATDFYGGTALAAAAKNGNLELVQFLLAHGAPPDVVTAANASAEVETPLQIAAECGHAEIVAALLKAGASTAGKDPYKRTPLQQAAMAGHAGCVQLLLAAGASTATTLPDLNNFTPLHFAATFGHAAVIEKLLAAHADISAQGSDGNTPLHLACFNNRPAAAEALIKAHAPINARNAGNQTPLMGAAINGSTAIVRALLAAGADPAAQDRAGKSVLQYASDYGDPQTLQLITAALTSATQPASQP